MKIGERGQVTIPQALREQFGFLPETEVHRTRWGTFARQKRESEVTKLYGRKQFGRSTDDLMKLLR